MPERFNVTPGSEASIAGSISDAFNERVGPMLLKAMQNLVPIRSGALYRALTYEVDDANPRDVVLRAGVDAGTDENVTYGLYVEEGTSRMKAQPFMRPALGQIGAKIK
jgi:HK97 gp10 family phage protein